MDGKDLSTPMEQEPEWRELGEMRARLREQDKRAERHRYELAELLAISRAIASEHDVVALFRLILEKSRYITDADAGSVYLVDEDSLHLVVSQNDSAAIDPREQTLPIDARSTAGRAVLERHFINMTDLDLLGQLGANPLSMCHDRSPDERSGYRTCSMLAFPLTNQQCEVIGVIQLVNRKRDPRALLRTPADFAAQVLPFDEHCEELCEMLAGSAGIRLENALLYEDIRRLFEGFVDASVTAIEARDPTTSGHSQRVARLTCGLAEAVNRTETGDYRGARFDREELQQLKYAALLHDFGKVGVREHVLVKARKLHEHELTLLLARFDYIRKAIEADCLRRRLAQARADDAGGFEMDAEARLELAHIDEATAYIINANEPTTMSQGSFERLGEIAALRYVDARGASQPYLTPFEVESLRVMRGSLTPSEREEIESHVLHTFHFLSTIPWGRKLRKIPFIAGTHHEKLDGSGYPWGLMAEEIPVEAKMMTIADIYDALTATDRPYKKAVPRERALAILEDEVRRGKCDGELLRLFIEARVWRRAAERAA